MEYPKIQTVWRRDPETKFRTLIEGAWATPELAYLANSDWVYTEMVNGTNIRVMWDGMRVCYRGKTDRAQIPTPLLVELRDLFEYDNTDDDLASVFNGSACLYGEGYGPKIQEGGELYRDSPGFVLFDVRVGDLWLKRADVIDIALRLGLEIVPMIGHGSLARMIAIAREGFHSQWGVFPAEGIVARPAVELLDRVGQCIICKIKRKDFVGK